MPVGIVTGASRGLGLALARALAERGWRLVVDARGAARSSAPSAASPASSRIPGDVADPEHRRAAGRGRRRGGSTCSSTTRACSARARSRPLADYPLDELARVYEVNVLAPLALVQLALPRLAARRGDPQHHLRRRRRALRGLGRLRLLEGRARAADRDPRRRAPGAPRLRRRPGRHAHADAPGGVPRRGHLRPAAARGERARPARADRGRRCRAGATAPASSRRCAA